MSDERTASRTTSEEVGYDEDGVRCLTKICNDCLAIQLGKKDKGLLPDIIIDLAIHVATLSDRLNDADVPQLERG